MQIKNNKNKAHLILIYFVSLFFTFTLNAQIEYPPVAQKVKEKFASQPHYHSKKLFIKNKTVGNQFKNYVKESTVIDIAQKELQVILNRKSELLRLTIPSENGAIDLQLFQTDILSDTYRLRDESGNIYHSSGTALFYRGTVKGVALSTAIVTVMKREIRILYSDSSGNHRISKVGDKYVMYDDQDITIRKEFDCQTKENPNPISYNIKNQKGVTQRSSITGGCVEIYFECDYESYQDNGSNIVNTEAWVTALFNEVTTLYANENIPIVIAEIKVWTTPDPYIAFTSTSDVLDEFVVQTNNNEYDGRLAHLLSTRSLGGGIAYLNVLCNNTIANAVSGSLSTNIVPFPTYSWTVEVVAHEMGHNFGSPHTHACSWNGDNTQIDDCGNQYLGNGGPCYDANNPILPATGSIMSYCHLVSGVGIDFNNGFGMQPGDLIYNNYINSTCHTGCSTDPAPANDECANAIPINNIGGLGTCPTNKVTGMTLGANESTPISCDGGGNFDIWYTFTVPSDGDYYFESMVGSPGIVVFTGSCGNLTEIACFNNASGIVNGLTTNTTYYAQVWSDIFQNTIEFCISKAPLPPSNDECGNAITINNIGDNGTCPGNLVSGVTVGANESISISCDVQNNYDIWYTFTIPSNGDYLFEAIAGNPGVVLYTGACGNFTEVTCIDNSSGVFPSLVIGTTYYAQIWTDNFEITVDFCISKAPGCDDNTYDPGGSAQSYSNNENWELTICPDIPTEPITITFNTFGIETNWDALYIHNGLNVSAPLFDSGNGATQANFPAGGYYGSTIPGPFTSTDASGCITFHFLSDGAVTGIGWDASITCGNFTPQNDECINAIVITVGDSGTCPTNQVSGITIGANESTTISCDGTDNYDIWYTFTVPTNGNYQFDSNTGNPGIVLYSGSTCNNMTEVVCVDNMSSLLSSLITNTTYFAQIWTETPNQAVFCISKEAVTPPNDNLCDAQPLIIDAPPITANNTNATVETNEPSGTCWHNNDLAQTTLWYSFIAPPSGNVTISTDFQTGLTDTQLGIYTATDCTDMTTLTQVGCDEDGGVIVSYNSIAVMTGLTPNEAYYIQVDGWDSQTGDFMIEIKDNCLSNQTVTENNDTSPNSLRSLINSVCPDGLLTIDATLSGMTLALANGEIIIDKNINIVNQGQNNYIIDGQLLSRIFNVESNVTLSLEGINLIKGKEVQNGGAIYNEGTLNLKNILFDQNLEGNNPLPFTNTGTVNIKQNSQVDVKD